VYLLPLKSAFVNFVSLWLVRDMPGNAYFLNSGFVLLALTFLAPEEEEEEEVVDVVVVVAETAVDDEEEPGGGVAWRDLLELLAVAPSSAFASSSSSRFRR